MSFELPEEALSETFLAASGPGGQNVNKVATACQLRCDVFKLGLAPGVYQRLKELAGSRMTAAGEIVITARKYRAQEANREDARARLAGRRVEVLLNLCPGERFESLEAWLLDAAARRPRARRESARPARGSGPRARASRIRAVPRDLAGASFDPRSLGRREGRFAKECHAVVIGRRPRARREDAGSATGPSAGSRRRPAASAVVRRRGASSARWCTWYFWMRFRCWSSTCARTRRCGRAG